MSIFQQVEFTVDKNKTGNQSGWNPQKVEAEFLKLFKRASNDEIFGWIDVSIVVQPKTFKTKEFTKSFDFIPLLFSTDFDFIIVCSKGKKKKVLLIILPLKSIQCRRKDVQLVWCFIHLYSIDS